MTWKTPPAFAEELGVSVDRVRGWIASGQLPAVNVSDSTKRPRWRISQEGEEAFLRNRSNQAIVAATAKRRRRQSDVIEFLKGACRTAGWREGQLWN